MITICKYYIKLWAQFRGGHEERVSPTFSGEGTKYAMSPSTFFSLGFVFGEDSKIKMFVMFCVKSYSC